MPHFSDIWSSSCIYSVFFLCMQENSTLRDDYVCPLVCHLNSSTWKPWGRFWWNLIFLLCNWRSLKTDLVVLNLKPADRWTDDYPIILYYFKYKMHIFSLLKIEVHLKFKELFISLQTAHRVAWKKSNMNTFWVSHQDIPPTSVSELPTFSSVTAWHSYHSGVFSFPSALHMETKLTEFRVMLLDYAKGISIQVKLAMQTKQHFVSTCLAIMP